MDYKKIFKSRNLRFAILRFLSWAPDSVILKIQYRLKQGRSLHLNDPKLFTEKIQWLKLNNREKIYHDMVDKARAKEYVRRIIGDEYIIPTYGVWKSFEEIDFEALPNSFVLKTNVGGGGLNVVVCKDKFTFDKKAAKEKLRFVRGKTRKSSGREWPYEGIERCIIAEAYMQNGEDNELTDYKFYCFNGDPKYCQVIGSRTTEETIDFYDMNWERQEFIGLNPNVKHSQELTPKPTPLNEMIDIARKLSKGQPFLRVDLYCINDRPYFGELTFYPASGYGAFNPQEWDRKLGDMIDLRLIKK
ncbi:MAG: hypothetical protein J5554_07935 [Paludibacteraceae bacterium]|nr:hypothetical protein [Paludibacteraceae bacterium]